MKIRKRLAVMMSGISNHSYQHLMLEGIIRQAFALDYDVAIFTPFLCYDNLTAYQKGENKIFDLVNYDMFDAVLYIPCAFYNDTVRGYVEPSLEACPIPVIAVESDDPRFHCVQMDDRGAFRRVTEHLIEKHGLSDILCLAGFKDNYQSEERVKGYLDAMQRHGLEVPEDHIVYGDFWIFNYGLEGTVLHTLSGGETPGVMTLELKDGVWTGTALEAAGDGEDYASDIRRFCAGDEALEALYFEASDAREGRTEETLRRFIREYVEANGLNVTAYQDPGWPPVSLTEGAAE